MKSNPRRNYVDMICCLFGDVYDDREEDSRFGGEDWGPGIKALHRSLNSFQKDLEEKSGITLSRTKLQKILSTGGCWITERSREIQDMYEKYRLKMTSKEAVKIIAKELGISTVSVHINLPYEQVVYNIEEKSSTARRIERHRTKK